MEKEGEFRGGMGDIGKSAPKSTENSLFWIILAVFFAFTVFMAMNYFQGSNEILNICNDGTPFGKCSDIKPYHCNNGTLAKNPETCGCPKNFNLSSDGKLCISNYQYGMKTTQLNYVIDGQDGKINFLVYQGFSNYTSKIPRSIEYIGNKSQSPSRVDFKLKSINDEIQRDALLELVAIIQKITPDKDEQARIAVSIVQNIPYGYANGTISISGSESVIYTRYPYEVLFDNQGICGEKSQLLAFLLREIGFGVAIFYNQQENHESVGIKCPKSESWHSTGYCFVETSGPAVISDSEIEYVGGIKITSVPQVLEISDGFSLSKNLADYSDAQDLMKIREKISESGEINYLDNSKLESLREKYGLDGEYNLV